MPSLRTLIVILAVVAVATSALAQGNFGTSLHKTRAGKDYWYAAENGGFEAYTNVPIEDLGCVECHGPTDASGDPYPDPYTPDCGDCHDASFNVSQDQCLSCHGRQATEAMVLGYSDVHRDMGMVCWDCHTSADVHGSSTVYQSMLEPGAVEADCENCHTTQSPEHADYDPHDGALHCTSCHAQTVISCYNCHFESQVDSHVKRAMQPLHDFVLLVNRTKDGKVYPATFQSLTYEGSAFAAFGPFTSHTITGEGARTCGECHHNYGASNAAIAEYNETGQIRFTEWDDDTKTLSWVHGVVPLPTDYETSFKMDFLTYTGATTDPPPGDANLWTGIGKDTWDGHQLFFATPLTEAQMAAIGMTAPVGVGEVPLPFAVTGNYPNPFNPATTIAINLEQAGQVHLAVFDVRGRQVRSLMQGALEAGAHEVSWNGRDDAGELVPSGTYLAVLSGAGGEASHKLVLAK